MLLEFDGLDIDRRSNKGTTALHDAAESNNVSIFEKLLKKGAKFLRNELQVSPLLTASLGGHEKIVRKNSYFTSLKLFLGELFRDGQISRKFWR